MGYVTESFEWWEEAQNTLLNMVSELRTDYEERIGCDGYTRYSVRV